MNAFSRQGKALPSEVRDQIIEKWLSNEGIPNISRQSNLPYETVSNIVDFRVVIRRQYLHCTLYFNSVVLIRSFRTLVFVIQYFSLVLQYFSSELQYFSSEL